MTCAEPLYHAVQPHKEEMNYTIYEAVALDEKKNNVFVVVQRNVTDLVFEFNTLCTLLR